MRCVKMVLTQLKKSYYSFGNLDCLFTSQANTKNNK